MKKSKWILIGISTFLFLQKSGIDPSDLSYLNILLFLLFMIPMVYLHEIGHVLAAKLVGIGISRVQFGDGREIWRKRIFSILVIIKSSQGGGYTFVGDLKKKFSKPAFTLFTAGGMLMQLLITVPLMIITDFHLSDFLGNGINVSASLIYANLFMVVLNLIPMKASCNGFKIANDGLNLIKLPFIKQRDIEEIYSAGKLMEAYELYEARRYKDAQNAFEKCMVLFPKSILAHFNYAASLLKQGMLDQGEREFLKIYGREHDKRYDPILNNNLAWLNLLKFDEESFRKADQYSREAFKSSPKVPYIRGTRASVLILTGEIEKGLEILKETVELTKPVCAETNSIVGFVMISYAHLKTGEVKRAEKYMNVVRKNLDKLDEDEKILFDKLKARSEEFRLHFASSPVVQK